MSTDQSKARVRFPDHLLIVRASVAPGREEEFNRWYDHEHVPDVLRLLPGVLGAARYEVGLDDGTHDYMAVYAFESAEKLDAAISGPQLKQLIALYDEAIGSFSTRKRTTYTKIFELLAKA
jgi:antibiotic biosynthesis monooxygenase (ABM) superfamily enzyme